MTRNYKQARFDFPDWTVAKLSRHYFSFLFFFVVLFSIFVKPGFWKIFCFTFSISEKHSFTLAPDGRKIRFNDERAEHRINFVSLVVKAHYSERKYNSQIIHFLNYIVQKGFFWGVFHKTNHWSVIKKTTSATYFVSRTSFFHNFHKLDWGSWNLSSLFCFSFFIIPYVPTISRGIVVKNDKNL